MTGGRISVFVVLALGAVAPLGAGEAPPLEEGRKLFTQGASPPCGMCHTLQDAGAAGAIGPSLDDLKPNAERVAKAVRSGVGLMPPYASLSDREVQALAQYVAKAAGAN